MANFEIGSTVKALSGSNTWMHQYDVVGTITELFQKEGDTFAKINVPRWLLKKNFGEQIIRDYLEMKLMKKEDSFLLVDEGVPISHLVLSPMPQQTTEEKVHDLVEKAFGPSPRLAMWAAYFPVDLIIVPGICVHRDCDQARTHLTWHNCWGTVEAFPCCETHYNEYNGTASDGFPIKQELTKRSA